MSDWLSGYGGPERQAPQDQPTTWRKGMRRMLVEIIVCEQCGSNRIKRINEYGPIAYWQCESCDHRQKDSKAVGRERVALAQ
jgi:ribosomal protein L37AE/L43A